MPGSSYSLFIFRASPFPKAVPYIFGIPEKQIGNALKNWKLVLKKNDLFFTLDFHRIEPVEIGLVVKK